MALLFAGGPAPAANAVISTAAVSFLRNKIDVIGVLHGYSHLVEYSPSNPLQEGRDYVRIDHKMLKRTRNSRGILIGTARTNPGKLVASPADLADPEKNAPLRTVYDALSSLGVDALISIGGDDTLKTANKFQMFQEHLPAGARRISVVHVPKTIDNDYRGIDFTFGYFTAVETLATEIRNLLADAEATRSYFLAETMGRSAGWLAYGAAIAGRGQPGDQRRGHHRQVPHEEETVTNEKTGQTFEREMMDIDEVVQRIVPTMTRPRARGEAVRRHRPGRGPGGAVCPTSTSRGSRATSSATSRSPR